MSTLRILWADDEIELLKPQVMFLEKRGYEVETVTNGHDALELLEDDSSIDLVLLDESMPGISGLETLEQIKRNNSAMPVVLITKNEAEDVMEEALGAQIDDYLIKPVKPNQILLSIKKLMDNKRLIKEKTSSDYQQKFQEIFGEISMSPDWQGWVDVYKKIVHWELRLDESKSTEMGDILSMQKNEANAEFSKYVEKNYEKLLSDPPEGLTFSPGLLRKYVFPHLKDDRPVVFLLLDNLRYDQWKILEPIVSDYFKVEDESFFYSILPTCTQYSRNAIFSGMMPGEIAKHHPDYWVHDHENEGKNMYERELLGVQINNIIRTPIKYDYQKITNVANAKSLSDSILNCLQKDLTCIVYNFIDMLSHARTEMEVLKELAGDESAYRSLTRSWFEHSPLLQAFEKLADRDVRIVIGTDHGTIRVNTPSKVVADRNTTTNLRYKHGRNLNFQSKDVLHFPDPKKVGLPAPHMSSSYIFAKDSRFFLYPNNYNHYNNYFNDTFQHGGISLEEIICPIITLGPR